MNLNALPLSIQHSVLVLTIAFLSIIAFASEYFIRDIITQTFVYQRELIIQGQLWRIFTGHILHTNHYHLLLNLAALILLWALHGRFYTIKNYSALFLFCCITTSAGIFYGTPSLLQYVGLSGVLHGIFVFGALMDIASKDKTGYLLFIGVWIKIGHEQIYGASSDVSSLIEASVAVDAHLWGAIGGLFFTMAYLFFIKLKSNKAS